MEGFRHCSKLWGAELFQAARGKERGEGESILGTGVLQCPMDRITRIPRAPFLLYTFTGLRPQEASGETKEREGREGERKGACRKTRCRKKVLNIDVP